MMMMINLHRLLTDRYFETSTQRIIYLLFSLILHADKNKEKKGLEGKKQMSDYDLKTEYDKCDV